MPQTDVPILVAGATGQQGGAVVRRLLADGRRVRALTRDPRHPTAHALAALGAEIVRGDMLDAASLRAPLDGVAGVFAVHAFWEQGLAAEIRQGTQLADAAHAAGVGLFVYSSVGGADRSTGVPHFESKWTIERHIRALGMPATIIRPVSFMENFLGFNAPTRVDGILTLSIALPADRPLQVVAVDDIADLAAVAFARAEQFAGREIDLAGDELTPRRAAAALSDSLGEPVRLVQTPLEHVRAFSEEIAAMYAWFDRVGYDIDIAQLRTLLPSLRDFDAWRAARAADGAFSSAPVR